MIFWIAEDEPFPALDKANGVPNGLLCASRDLSPMRVLEAYKLGIFPWYNPGEPVFWWSPDPRMVLRPSEFKLSRSLRQRMKRGGYEIRLDTSFSEVMQACSDPRDGQAGTWIGSRMMQVYGQLHEAGYAHSVETWINGELAGGLYGLAIGRVFYGESMFTRQSDASKLALAHLCEMLSASHYELIDCQMETAHLASLGARPIPRIEFIQELQRLVNLQADSSFWNEMANSKPLES